MVKKLSLGKRALKRIGKITLSLVSTALIINSTASPSSAIDAADAAKEVIGSDGGKEVLNQALKIGRSKPAISIAAAITCIACIPAAGVAASPTMCIACGILIAKTLG